MFFPMDDVAQSVFPPRCAYAILVASTITVPSNFRVNGSAATMTAHVSVRESPFFRCAESKSAHSGRTRKRSRKGKYKSVSAPGADSQWKIRDSRAIQPIQVCVG